MTTLAPIPNRRPAGVRKSSVLGPNGKPVSLYLYPSPRHNPRAYKPRQWTAAGTKENVGECDRQEMVNLSRQLVSGIDVLNTAIKQKNDWAFGDAWDVHYTGTNPEWGAEMEDFINNVWMPNCNVRGPQYDFKTSQTLSGIAFDRDGDDAMVLTESEAGFPMLAFYPATRICNYSPYASGARARGGLRRGSNYPNQYVVGGAFDGARIFDGVIMDRNGRAIALRIMDEEGNHADISAFNADLAYEPAWADQGRGIPRVAVSVLRWMNRQDIEDFMQRGMKRACAVGLIHKYAEGEATPNEVLEEEEDLQATGTGPEGTTNEGRTVFYEEVEGGESYYLSAPDGESVEGLNYKNPHPNVEAFLERITRESLSQVGWFLELIDLKATGRAPSRILCDLANQSIWSRQKTGYRRFRRAVSYAIAKAMKSGYLRRNPDMVDALSYEPGLPKPLQVDAGNDAQADREALKMGMTTKAIYAQKAHGIHYRHMDKQRELEILQTIEAAERLSTAHPKINFDKAMELLEQRSPNPISQQQQKTTGQQDNKTTGRASVPASQGESVSVNLKLQQPPPRKRAIQVKRDDRGAIVGYEQVEMDE